MTHHHTPNPVTANNPASSEVTAACGDSGGIDGGSERQAEQKTTGVFTVTDTVVAYTLPPLEFIQMKEGMLYQRLMNVLTPALADGRQYAVQIQPLQKKPKEDKNVLMAGEWTLTATVFLVHAADCLPGECCIPSAIDTGGYCDVTTWMDIAGKFERLEGGSGWRRIA